MSLGLSRKIEYSPFHLYNPISTIPLECFTHSCSSTLRHSCKHVVEGRFRELLPSLEVFLFCIHGSQVPAATPAFSHSRFSPTLMRWASKEDGGLEREPTKHTDKRKLLSFLCCELIPFFLYPTYILCHSFSAAGDSGAQCGHINWMQGERLIVFNSPICHLLPVSPAPWCCPICLTLFTDGNSSSLSCSPGSINKD